MLAAFAIVAIGLFGGQPKIIHKPTNSLELGTAHVIQKGNIAVASYHGSLSSFEDFSFITTLTDGTQSETTVWHWGGGLVHSVTTTRGSGENEDHWHLRHQAAVLSALKIFKRDEDHP